MQTDSWNTERAQALGVAAIGGCAAVAGVAALLQAAWAQGLIGPAHATIASLAMGLVALASGEFAWSRRLQPMSLGLTGAGLGTLSLSLFAAHAWYGWIPASVAVVLLSAVSGLGAWIAVRRDSQILAVLTLITASAVPGLLWGRVGADLALGLVAIADAGAVWAATRRGWRALVWGTVVASALAWGASIVVAVATPGIAVASVTVAGAAYAAGAMRTRSGALPMAAGVVVSAIAVLAQLPGASSVLIVAVGLVGGLLQAVALKREADTEATVVGIAMAFATLASVLLVPDPSPTTLVALATPFVASAAAIASAGSSRQQSSARGVLVVLGAAVAVAQITVVAFDPRPATTPWIGAWIAAMGWIASLEVQRPDDGIRPALAPEATLLIPATAVLGGLWLCVPNGPSVPQVVVTATLASACILTPTGIAVGDTSDRRWGALLISVVPLAALALAWHQTVGTLWGVPLLGVSAVATLGAALSRRLRPEDASTGATLYGILALCAAATAVPAQLSGLAWTLGWSGMAVAVAVADRRWGGTAPPKVMLALAAGVGLRLLVVPEVYGYGAVGAPSAWAWVPAAGAAGLLALAAAIARPPIRPHMRAIAIGVAFTGANLQLSHALAAGWVTGDAALRTALWAVTALGLLTWRIRWVRRGGLVMLLLILAKVVVRDLWLVQGLARAGVLLGVAACFLVSAGLLQRSQTAEAT